MTRHASRLTRCLAAIAATLLALLVPELAAAGTASFVRFDTTTQGSWKGVYGSDGYNVFGDAQSDPGYAAVGASGYSVYTWAASTTDVRGLQKAASATDRIATTWYSQTSSSYAVVVNDGATHALALYAVDWDGYGGGRAQTIEIRDTATNALLDSRDMASFGNGLWAVWNISGSVTVVVRNTNPSSNAVLFGLFFGPPGTPPPPPPPGSASFVRFDATTQGSWKGVYGSDGFNVINDTQSYPAYASVLVSGQSSYTWAASTSDVRALQKAASPTDRIASTWYTGLTYSYTVTINDGLTHGLALYSLDWDNYNGRTQTIEMRDAATDALLDTRNIASFVPGMWAVWNIGGSVKIVVRNTNPSSNAVISGLFFGTPTNNLLANGGFEAGATATGAYLYSPTDQGPWVWVGGSGVTGANSGFTSANSSPPEGRLGAFLQSTGTIAQTFSAPSAGSFFVSFRVVNRANYGCQQTVAVSIDGGTVLQMPIPASPIPNVWMSAATPSFNLSAGTHTLQLTGLTSADCTAFIDDVQLAPATTFTPTTIAGSFEEWQIGPQNYHYNLGAQPWNFTLGSGVTANGSAFGAPNAPQGAQAAFVQAGGSMQQTWTDAGASYQLRFSAAARTPGAVLAASIDGISIGTWPLGSGYATYTVPVGVASGTHTIRFTSTAADSFVDDIQLGPPVVVGAPGGFNAFESSTPAGAIIGVIHTKVAGSPFVLDLAVLDSTRTAVFAGFARNVKVEILDASDNSAALDASGCRSSWAPVSTSAPLVVAFAPADGGRKTITLSDPQAWRELRLRISTPSSGAPTTVACSSDNFANRPAAFASFALSDADSQSAGTARSLANAAATGGNVHKAGRPFTLQATSVNGAGAITSGYAGTPTLALSACAGTACAAGWSKVADEGGSFVVAGTRTVRYGKGSTWTTLNLSGASACSNAVFGDPLVGTVKECDVATFGVVSATPTAVGGVISRSATYSEAGSIALQLVDTDFASVDATDGSSLAEMSIASAVVAVGRFVPDHFDVTALAAPVLRTFDSTSCTTRSFTYVGQPFGYASAAQARVLARNASGVTTNLYAGPLWKLSGAGLTQSFTPTPVAPALDVSAATAPTLTSNDDGTGLLVAIASDKLRFAHTGATPTAPFNADIALSWSVRDASEAGVAGNGTIDTTTALVFSSIAFDAGSQFRFGVLRLTPAYGSELIDLPVLIEAQYWDGQRLATNAADQCTALPAAAIAMGNYQRSLAACKTAVGSAAATLVGGRAYAKLAKPGSGNSGSVDLALQLGPVASGQTCSAVGAAAAATTSSNLPWLQGRWGGAAAFDQNPSTRASFGQYRSPLIYQREMF